MGATDTLTPRQRGAVIALATAPTVEAAAAAAGVSRKTVYRWMDSPAFVAAVEAAQADVLTAAQRKLGAALGAATAAILAIMADDSNPAHVRLRAAEMVIDSLLKLKQVGEFERRLSELEAANGNAE